jgi:putative ABC transport system permease protein
VLARLDLAIGDRVRVGDAEFAVRATIAEEPDRVAGGIRYGPRVMIATDALADTGLVQPGSLIRHYYRVALPPETKTKEWVETLGADLPQSGWRVRDTTDPQPSIKRWIDRLTLLLTLVGLATLLVGGIGVGGAVKSHLDAKAETIATLKCLGGSNALIFRVYLVEVLGLAGLGTMVGLALGVLAAALAANVVAGSLAVPVAPAIYLKPLSLAAAFGLLTALAFALWPLGRASEMPAASLFRDLVAGGRHAPKTGLVALIVVITLALAGLAIASVGDSGFAAWFVGGSVGALLILRATAGGLARLARAAPRQRRPSLRLALANLHRPGAPTVTAVVSLGMGMTLLAAVALVAGNLAHQVDMRLADDAQAFFFIDIQPDQLPGFEETVASVPGAGRIERAPHLRGRITRLNGVPVEQVRIDPDAAWTTRSDRGITYAAEAPRGNRIVAGEWWPADYAGPPLVSLGARAAHGLGLGVGDTLTVNVLGRDIEGRIANLREIDWSSLGINFVIMFSPGSLEAAPQTHIATVQSTREAEEALYAAVTERFPNITAVAVREVLEAVSRVIGQVGVATHAVAGLALVAGSLVVAGAIAAGQRRRVRDAVVLKVLGATRADIAWAHLVEYALMGLTAGMAASALGTLAGYLVVTRVMRADWQFQPEAVIASTALCLALALVIGFAGTWRALGRKAAPVLRHE